MTVPLARSELTAQWHTLSDDDTCLISAQRWQDPQRRDRQWLVVIRNGQPADSELFTGPRRLASLDERVQRIVGGWESRRGLLDERRARAELRRLTGQHPQQCDRFGCGEVLPLGRRVCLVCGASTGRVAAGMLSGVRRRGARRWRRVGQRIPNG